MDNKKMLQNDHLQARFKQSLEEQTQTLMLYLLGLIL